MSNKVLFKRQLDNYQEIEHNNAVCPHCFTEDEDSWEYKLYDDGDEKTVVCGNCGEEFNVKVLISIAYVSTKKKEE